MEQQISAKMGKVTCVACNKKCKGQTIKLTENAFFHPKCFTCKECKKELPSNAFFVHNRAHYCTQDYQRLFGTKCHSCDKYVEGEVVTVMEKTFHRQCIVCSKCRQNIGAGNKLRVLNGEFLCQSCVSEAENERIKEKLSKPHEDFTLKRLEPISIGRDQIASPDSDIGAADMRDGDENILPSPDIRSPASATSGYKSDVSVDLDLSGVESPQDKRNTFSPDNNTYAPELQPPRQRTPNDHHEFGKFYPTSFLGKGTSFKRGPSMNLQEKSQQHFHRPGDFSYRTVRDDIIIKHIRTGMMNRLGTEKRHTTSSFQRTGDPPYKPNKSQEPIQLAKIPDAQRFGADHKMPIEREDFVARPETAAVRPELLRDLSFRVTSMQNGDVVDNKENESEDTVPPDPKTAREINELSKMSTSGAAQFFLGELKKKKLTELKDLDPISSSRMPSAAAEPFKRTRYESPIFASPSRDVLRKKFWQFEEDRNNRNRKCYTPSAPRPGYGLRSRTLDLRNGAMSEMAFRGREFDPDFDPGSGRNSASGVHMASLGLRNGYVSDTTDGYYPSNFMSYYRRPATSTSDRTYTPVSDVEDYDPNTGLRVTKNIFRRLNILVDGRLRPSSRTSLRRSVPAIFSDQEGAKIYPYEKLRLDCQDRPPGLDKNALEQYLDDGEFEQLFKMSMAEFMVLAEWKRNDLKKRVVLFETSCDQPPSLNTSLEKPPTPMAT